MSPDVFREVSSRGWLSRIGGSIVGGFIGLALFIIAIPVVFWNEGRAVQTYESLKEGAAAVVEVQADAVDPANEGKLVHLTAEARAGAPVEDGTFGLSFDALAASRNVEMYQWVEHRDSKTEKKLGGGEETVTTYRYEKDWLDDPVDSSDFKHPDGHRNPSEWPYTSEDFTAEEISAGPFTLGAILVNQLNFYEDAPVSTDDISEALRGEFKNAGDGIYRGSDPASPQVGDLRIRYSVVNAGLVSIIARQVGETLDGYPTKAGDELAMVEQGAVTSGEMFKSAAASNKMLTWIVRLVSLLVMIIGLAMVFKPLSVLADVVPFFGNIVQFGTGLLAFALAAVVWLVVLVISWIAARPVLGISLCVVAVALVVMLRRRKPKAA